MNPEEIQILQRAVSAIRIPFYSSLHEFRGVPRSFLPWECDLSPSALYNCSLACRKKAKLKTPETKWMSIKRWVTITPEHQITLPPGTYLSIKRKEEFIPSPAPHFDKKEYILMMFPYGNVWSQRKPDVPIDEKWLWEKTENMTILEALMRRDAAQPLPDYFASCHRYMLENPDQIGIHLKRKKKEINE
jgi:hypothetical protein